MAVGFLATGSELINGDVLNSNSHKMAQLLNDNNIACGQHLSCSDDENDIVDCLHYLSQKHPVIIITGGLGPTSDDRTRFALANHLTLPLEFDNSSWQQIVIRLSAMGLAVAETNRQQALFPQTAVILPNHNGSANGCLLKRNDVLYIMLPGPPHECLPIFEQQVLPILQKQLATQHHKTLYWRVFGVSEGEFAETMDNLLSQFQLTTGYRWFYPYIDFKVSIQQPVEVETIKALIDKELEPFIICSAKQTALEELRQWLNRRKPRLVIDDNATGGLLQSQLLNPETVNSLSFSKSCANDAKQIVIDGLRDYWDPQPNCQLTPVTLNFIDNNHTQRITLTIPYRQSRTLLYAIELIAFHITNFLTSAP